jgi:sigma-B regulation protein RsbU (phosphoserine phosphatase)
MLRRLGYEVLQEGENDISVSILDQRVVDLIVIDSRNEENHDLLYHLIRSQQHSKRVPIVYIADESVQVPEIQGEKIEVISSNVSLGVIASKIALQLRLRKFDGADKLTADVTEINATLRDVNERLMKERAEARAIQQALLPNQLPKHSSFEMAVYYSPLDEVGGDWYQASFEDEQLSFLVADVTGHGLAAALLGSMTKLAMSAVHEKSPDLQLSGMNRLMTPQLPEGRFVTLGCGLFQPNTATLLYASAGHPPSLVFFRDVNEVHEVKGKGFALGFFEESSYSLQEIDMAPGDIFLAFTDGITEAQNLAGEMYGTTHLKKVLVNLPDKYTAQEVLNILLDDFKKFLEERILKDDVTMLVLVCR